MNLKRGLVRIWIAGSVVWALAFAIPLGFAVGKYFERSDAVARINPTVTATTPAPQDARAAAVDERMKEAIKAKESAGRAILYWTIGLLSGPLLVAVGARTVVWIYHGFRA